MHRFAYCVELLDDLVISRDAATVGGHEGLDYLPGQLLLGAAAARLYRALGTDAFRVFHSGAVRFGQAWPLVNEAPGWPMPFCWHERKAEPAKQKNRLQAARIANFQHQDGFELGKQPQQLRGGYLDQTGQVVNPTRHLRMKTALDADGRAAEGQLFGYQAIERGSRFGGWIEADSSVDEQLFKQVISTLTDGDLLLGRSRSAEYGRVRLTGAGHQPPAHGPLGQTLTLWLLSDLALLDKWGQPTLTPTPDDLGLPAGGKIDWDRTFLRSRTYRTWNGARGAPDLERAVIEQGSVIALELDAEPDPAALVASIDAGLGLWREAGLGQVWVNPPLLATAQPVFAQRDTRAAANTDARTKTTPSHPLIDWLDARTTDESRGERIEGEALNMAADYRKVLAQAAAEVGLTLTAEFGPSRAQWGRVLETARTGTPGTLLERLFLDQDRRTGGAVIKPTAEGWQEAYWNGNARVSLGAWLQERLTAWRKAEINRGSSANRADQDLARLTQRLGQLCRDETGRR